MLNCVSRAREGRGFAVPACPKGSGEARRSQEDQSRGENGPQSLRRLEQCWPGQLLQELGGQTAMLGEHLAPLMLNMTLRKPMLALGAGVGFFFSLLWQAQGQGSGCRRCGA